MELSNFDIKSGISRIVNINEFINEYNILKFGNGGSQCRKSSNKKLKIATCKKNGEINYLWNNINDTDKNIIKNEFYSKCKIYNSGNNIQYIGIFGYINNNNINHRIKKEILNFYKTKPCCVCNIKSNVICDHKNDLYNDPRVLNINTQTINDFQSLCISCNL